MAKKKRKVRTDFRKNRVSRARKDDWTSQFHKHAFAETDTLKDERVSGKGDLTRQRTVMVEGDGLVGNSGDAGRSTSTRPSR